MSRQEPNKADRDSRHAFAMQGASQVGNKIIALSTEGKEVIGTVVFARKAQYKKPSFA